MPAIRTGSAQADATDDFLRARRRAALAALRRRLLGDSGVDVILPFAEVVTALGRTGARDLGIKVIALDSIVGTVDRPNGFDRQFRPTTPQVRARWERIAAIMRAGGTLPPIDVLRVGEVHFVKDGHHRVSVARALGMDTIDAHVREVLTAVGATKDLVVGDLALKSHERVFLERVPLPEDARRRVRPSDPWDFGALAETVEAWAFRWAQDHHALTREEAARVWYEEEYRPVVALIRDAGMLGEGTETDAYLRVGADRYRLLRTHEWSEDVLQRLREAQDA